LAMLADRMTVLDGGERVADALALPSGSDTRPSSEAVSWRRCARQ
jgi:hypothetical protein